MILRVNKISYLFFLTLFFLILGTPSYSQVKGTQCKAILTTDINAKKRETVFSAYDKIYLLLEVEDLLQGEYIFASDWIAPDGRIEKHYTDTVEVSTDSRYMYYSWIKILRKGPLQRTFTGQDFDLKFIGTWIVHVYVENKRICNIQFEIY